MIRGGDWYGGWGPPAATDAPPGWRLLTVADFGAIVEGTAGQGITLTDSGDPLYPLRLTYTLTGAAVSNVCWPIIGDAAAILDRQAMANPIIRAKVTFPAVTQKFFGLGVGSFDGTTVASALGAGAWFQTQGSPPTLTGRVGKAIFSSGNLSTVFGYRNYTTFADASPANAFVTLWAPDGGSQPRLANSTLGDASLTGLVGTSLENANGQTQAALTAGTREWCLVSRKGTSDATGSADLAIWIMATPPPSPYVPQP